MENSIKYIDRVSKEIKVEDVPASNMLFWLYTNPFGVVAKDLIVKRAFLSRIYGLYCDLKISKKKIKPFIKQYKIDESEFLDSVDSFDTFNQFFVRKLKKEARLFSKNKDDFLSVCDGKVIAFEDVSNLKSFFVKGKEFSLTQLLDSDELADKFKNYSMLIFRLAPVDYHRYHYNLDSEVLLKNKIRGFLSSVSPIALQKKFDIFLENKRELTLLKSDSIGEYVYLEIGATMVGSIVTTNSNKFVKRGDEKGYFKFGGSSIILLVDSSKVKIDDDILLNTKNHLETSVKAGEKIGKIF